ncbi:poly-gamma-glutamate synthase PgsB [Micromonospora sp. WMMD980]|uniref:poly-gamma-glutamate synthase PgsB n=1 Tax=Micromonospora sp. WMMD980 TaxID=3016088 RepID=UPI002416056E|nr:poly-gamma-glutamate synthase PgsB [Micromonospora sp. WMMD980]MDG4803413.1 poly-gamma-glutamate synthase PgsB [Micromonospora sp. WMMD980]
MVARPAGGVTEMLFLYLVFLLACLGLLVAGIIEQRNHQRGLHGIPHRVLVNGIRGKSSITRLTAGALRGGKLVVVAKTTGTAARFIFPDASEEPVYRKFGIANVVEQIGIVRRAASYYPDVLVIECMAVMPPLQELNQAKLIQSTIGILCNVREDHLAEMGPTLDDVARSLSRSMPVGGICVTAEQDRLHILEKEADKRGCKLISVDPGSVTDDEMKGFTWTTFKENVAIALKVAELLGVPRRAALAGMWTAPPDPGVLSVEEYRAGSKSLRFANIFAANDPESTFMNIQQLADQNSIPRPLHVLINCRPDRVERNGQMGGLISRIGPDKIILIGEPTRSARLKIDDRWQDRVVDLGGKRGARELLDGVLDGIDQFASVLAIGNIHGQGEVLLAQLAGLTRPGPQDRAAPPALPATPGPTPYGAPRSPGASLPRPRAHDVPPARTGNHPSPAARAAREPQQYGRPPAAEPYGARGPHVAASHDTRRPYGPGPRPQQRPAHRPEAAAPMPYDGRSDGRHDGPPRFQRPAPSAAFPVTPHGPGRTPAAPQARHDPDQTVPAQPAVRRPPGQPRPPARRPDPPDPDEQPPQRPSGYWSSS